MLSQNQISVLQHIIDNEEELIIELAEENNLNSDASIGVAHFLLADVNNFSQMSTSQIFHYEKAIKPLIHRVHCDGMIGDHEDGSSSCIGDGFIDEETLLGAYLEQDMRCQHCIQTTDDWYANNP
ncbi:hypothetical protein [Acinetobacter sp. yr461]|uniref:hypothetical protein n=1 Tax=Acinetobacter sp. yr461 TaxID=1761742 RepID=UPI0008C1F7E0|nr:hypothetical protein [Acinetobacter sp. yr461]SEO14225.1 hypothetical protein SAMN04487817_101616 [Acinetobacter sp. yr461]